MRIHSEQLIPGCKLIKPVMGKTSYPIVPEKTALTDVHISFIQAFLIDQVDVYNTLEDGSKFIPGKSMQTGSNETEQPIQRKDNQLPILTIYEEAIKAYAVLFMKWQGNAPIQILEVGKLINKLTTNLKAFSDMLIDLPVLAAPKSDLYRKSVCLSIMASFLGGKMGLSKKDVKQLGTAGLLCDAGLSKMAIDITQSWGNSDFRKHPVFSYRLIENVQGIQRSCKLAVLQHHERLDGSGFPMGLKADKLHIFSKIIAVCDTFYQKRRETPVKSSYKIMEQMKQDEFTKLDPIVMKRMMRHFANLSTGAIVELSNGHQAKVMHKEPDTPTRPIVQLSDTQEIVALKDHPAMYIDKKISN